MGERRRLAELLVAAFGTVVAHAAGYALAGASGGSAHAYLGTVWWWLAPLGLLAAGALVVEVARSAELTDVRWQRLATLQMGLFAVQEVVERLADGASLHGLASRAVLVALLAQLVVAAGLARLISSAGRSLAAWLDPPTTRGWPATPSASLRPVPALVPARVGAPRARRGPPRR